MAITYSSTLRTTRITVVLTAIEGSASAPGLLKLYNGTKSDASGSTLLATLTLADPAGTVSGNTLTFDCDPVLTATVEAGATATGKDATWARITDSAGTMVADLTVSNTAGTGDIKLTNVTLIAGGEVSISAASITEGNA